MPIRDRLDTLSRGELAGLVAVLVITIAGAGLWYTRSLPRPVQIAGPSSAPPPSPAASGGPGAASASPSGTPVIIDVTGWVKDPGVYEFALGDRVIDAVNRAGGPRKGADLSSINLAAILADGTQIVIPKVGSGTTASDGAPGSSGTGGTPLVNVNTAAETELETLNGVGPVLANAIIQYRAQHGPFHTVDDLDDVSGIGPATLEQLRP